MQAGIYFAHIHGTKACRLFWHETLVHDAGAPERFTFRRMTWYRPGLPGGRYSLVTWTACRANRAIAGAECPYMADVSVFR
jgi:hypothetical protein